MTRLGVSLQTHNEVEKLGISNGRITGVSTRQGSYSADKVVLAGGAWSGRLLRDYGHALAVRPVRGQMLLFQAHPGVLDRMILADNRYLIPRKDGHILVGSTLEEVGFDKQTTDAAADSLTQTVKTLFPPLLQYPLVKHWAGLRPGSPQGIPYISAVPDVTGLYVNTGHFRNGVVLGPASARLLRNLILGQEPIVDPQAYQLQRG